jgi:hypothetical protein
MRQSGVSLTIRTQVIDALVGKPTEQLRRECDLLFTELYRLIRKYQALRVVVQELTENYSNSRFYPIMPRYLLLKNFIKQVLRAPAFAEVCHEPND